ncbi:5'/3'-nucleotidase SurE [Amycolatopsis antarctica]|uniref:5'-nucleotidase n=1 Tax=Amycolatopsis antarctica TaxID=1854586 RepID=A0A263CYX7_9PSEU|nr:5'/3'-nucleotidase SurE [Amycolatopsis antarctica]
MRALITNDDGIGSEGLVVLALAAVEAGLEVTVAAPHTEASGTGAGLTVVPEDGRSVVEKTTLDGLDGIPCFTVTAHPAFITLAAIGGTFGPAPDVVLSGVNRGANTGRAVLHSGTVGAALTAGANGLLGLAASLVVRDGPPRWDTAAALLPAALPPLLGAEPGTVLNVNVPDVPPAELGALTDAGLSSAGVVQARTSGEDGPATDVATTVVPGRAEPGTDEDLLDRGLPTVTSLRPVSAAGGRFGQRPPD